jgi:hypothetical protein
MKLVNMKLDPAEAKKMAEPCAMGDAPRYPWGLQLNLDNDAIEKLGIDKLPAVGKSLQLVALVNVVSVSSNQTEGGDERKSVSLQITDLGLEAGKKKSAEAALYGADDE